MQIEIKKENYKQLVQCIYLGNLIINEYKKGTAAENEYSEFTKNVFTQIALSLPENQNTLNLKNLHYERTEDTLLADFIDKIEDSVRNYYEEYRNSLFNEMLADKIADRNYPVVGVNESDILTNIIAKNLYFEILQGGVENFAYIGAPKICEKIRILKF